MVGFEPKLTIKSYSTVCSQNLTRLLPSRYPEPFQRNSRRFMSWVVVLSQLLDCLSPRFAHLTRLALAF
jgi:hypothetical protein